VVVGVADAEAGAEPELATAARWSNPVDMRDLTAQSRSKRFSRREIRTAAIGENASRNILELLLADA